MSQLISNKSVKVTPRLENQDCAGEEALDLDGCHSIENVHGWEARGIIVEAVLVAVFFLHSLCLHLQNCFVIIVYIHVAVHLA